LENHIKEIVKDCPRIDSVVARAKSIKSFTEKALKEKSGELLYTYPLIQIQDQIGVRIICHYKSDVNCIKDIVKEYFTDLEEQYKHPDDPKQFDYEGVHFIFYIPSDFRNPSLTENECPKVFELQIKTLYQHAWAEANHELGYKNEKKLEWEQKRKIAFTAAQSWGADEIFDDLFHELSNN
jgi:ppGpp synthetase/RelA/SpoT-type nucleotidyltranferase